MSTGVSNVKIKDYSQEVLDELEDAVKRALTKCGMVAEEYAADLCPVDTGLLRNSITYALSGEPAAISSYKADRGDKSGTYSGSAPDMDSGAAVYIGTNVEYAEIVELGKRKQPYLEPAVANHAAKYKSIIKSELGG